MKPAMPAIAMKWTSRARSSRQKGSISQNNCTGFQIDSPEATMRTPSSSTMI